MWIHARHTLAQSTRNPLAWAVLGMGLFGGWVAGALSILAVAEDPQREGWLIHGTSQLVAALTTLLVLARSWASDARAGFTAAIDAAGPGPRGRALGRWAGATGAGIAMGALLLLLLGVLHPQARHENPIYLLSTIICLSALLGAWSLLAHVCVGGTGALLLSLLVWGAGLLPWGAPEGPGGKAMAWLGRLLPSPARGDSLASGAAVVLATMGLLLLSLSRMRAAAPRP